MIKTKVIRLLKSVDSGLNDIKDNQEPVMQALTEYVRSDVKDLKEELNSKPVMPPAFDEWKKQYLNNRCELLYWIAELESGGEESKQDNDLSD